MLRLMRQTVAVLALLSLLTGLVYPLIITGIAQAVFPSQANGSLVFTGGAAVGSRLIGQQFSGPRYFWSRPSATSPAPYNAASSSGSNLGPTNPSLADSVAERVRAIQAADLAGTAPVPVDLVTASGSGLDPDISPAAARYQIARVARARGMEEYVLVRLVERHTRQRQFGVLGEPRVNVLELNLELDDVARRAGKQ